MNGRDVLFNAAAAALYAALTLAFAPLSYGPVQARLSECMTLLAFYNRKWVPGLTAGCFLANLASPFGAADVACGTAATFLAVWAMGRCPSVWAASLCPAVANGLIIGAELLYLAEIPRTLAAYVPTACYIAAGELLSVAVFGTALFRFLLRNETLRRYIQK